MPMGRKLFAAWVTMAILMLVAGYLFTYQEELRLNLDKIARTHLMLSMIYDLENNLAETEALVRGFIITGDDKQLQAYPEETREIERVFAELSFHTENYPEQRKLLDKLRPLVAKRLGLYDQAITFRREKGFSENQYPNATPEGRKVQADIKQILDKMEIQEKKQLNPGWAKQKKKVSLWLWGLSLGTFLSFSILLLVLYLLNKEVLQRKRAEEQLAAYQADLRSLASQLTLAEEQERRRLAVHLHDQIGQNLALSNIKLQELRSSLEKNGANGLMGEVDNLSRLLTQTIEETQSLTSRISPPILYDLGLEAALEWLTERFSQQHGLLAYFESDRQPKPVDENLRVLLFQAVQELLVNVVKHARAHSLKVSMWRQDDSLHIGVEDDGVGYDPSIPPYRNGKGGGFGLFSIRERLRPLGGKLEVKSEPNGGTEFVLSVPLELTCPWGVKT
jgi:signal transduction histidine kinase